MPLILLITLRPDQEFPPLAHLPRPHHRGPHQPRLPRRSPPELYAIKTEVAEVEAQINEGREGALGLREALLGNGNCVVHNRVLYFPSAAVEWAE